VTISRGSFMLTVLPRAREEMTVDRDDGSEETFRFRTIVELVTPRSWHVVARNLTTGRLFAVGRLGRVTINREEPPRA
jgi:hypothetical protein